MSMDTGFTTPLVILGLLAATFALAYIPIVTHLSKGLISQYTKADIRKKESALLSLTASWYSLCVSGTGRQPRRCTLQSVQAIWCFEMR